MSQIKTIKNHTTGRKFTMRVVENGESYGHRMALTHDQDDPLVEFYDATYDFDKDPQGVVLGQFVSRYSLMTLLGREGLDDNNVFDDGRGLNLSGGVAEWSIDAAGMEDARQALSRMGLLSSREEEMRAWLLEEIDYLRERASDRFGDIARAFVEEVERSWPGHDPKLRVSSATNEVDLSMDVDGEAVWMRDLMVERMEEAWPGLEKRLCVIEDLYETVSSQAGLKGEIVVSLSDPVSKVIPEQDHEDDHLTM